MEPLLRGAGWVATAIDGSMSRQVVQRVFHLRRGRTPWLETGDAEDVLYVASGHIVLEWPTGQFEARRGAAMLVPPNRRYRLANEGPGDAEVVSVVARRSSAGREIQGTHEDEEEALPAGDYRYFKLLVDPRHGATRVTQFVGFIERSRAPVHTHTYEEAIYILEGEGVVHIDDSETPIQPGTSIFLPPGTPHCLENRSNGVLKLLGVFSPPGSPAGKEE
jgi:mannose-6-phosphate isomerase-like protein (cupin superfamily)